VDGLLEGPFLKNPGVGALAVKRRVQARQGDEGAFLPGVRQAEDEVEFRHVEVYPGDPQHQVPGGLAPQRQQGQEGLGPVLPPPPDKGRNRHGSHFPLHHLGSQFPTEAVSHKVQHRRRRRPAGDQNHPEGGRGGGQGSSAQDHHGHECQEQLHSFPLGG
jgi:hypothetical protein